MPTNDFKALAIGGSANVLSQAAFAALTSLIANGFQSGEVESNQFNKVLRQSSVLASTLAQLTSDVLAANVLDDGNQATLEAQIAAMLRQVGYAGTAGGTVNALTASLTPASATLIAGMAIDLQLAGPNTGAMTLNLDAHGVKAIVRNSDGAAFIGGEFVGPQIVRLRYDGTSWRVDPPGRIRLQANTTFFVSTAGSDSNNGLTSGTAWLTLQHAWTAIQNNYDLNGFLVTVSIANGTYGGVQANGGLVGAGFVNGFGGIAGQVTPAPILFQGNVGAPASVIVSAASSNCFEASQGTSIALTGMTLTNSGGSASALAALNGGTIGYSTVVFGACAANQVFAEAGGIAYQYGNYTISGAAQTHFAAAEGGKIFLGGGTITVTGTPAFSSAFAQTYSTGLLVAGGITFTGAATGVRYVAQLGGIINTSAGGANYFPGNSAGSTASGGQYA